MNKEKFVKSISIRCNADTDRMIKEIKEILPLNTSSIMRLALIKFYREQKKENSDLNDK